MPPVPPDRPIAEPVLRKSRGFSLVWIVPIVATEESEPRWGVNAMRYDFVPSPSGGDRPGFGDWDLANVSNATFDPTMKSDHDWSTDYSWRLVGSPPEWRFAPAVPLPAGPLPAAGGNQSE